MTIHKSQIEKVCSIEIESIHAIQKKKESKQCQYIKRVQYRKLD